MVSTKKRGRGRGGGSLFTFIVCVEEWRAPGAARSSVSCYRKNLISPRKLHPHIRLYIDQVRARKNFSFFLSSLSLSFSLVPCRHWLNVSCPRDTRHKYRDISKCICAAKYPGCLSDKRWIIWKYMEIMQDLL